MTQHFRISAPFAPIKSPAPALSRPLHHGWTLARSKPGEWSAPGDIPAETAWRAAIVPGTVAATIRQTAPFDLAAPPRFDDDDFWYHVRFTADEPQRLTFHGLATIADVYVNGRLAAQSLSMFAPLQVDLAQTGVIDLHLAFRALTPRLAETRSPRARWRTKLAEPATLRFWRTTLLGRMPGWCPPVQTVGPWRPIERLGLTEALRVEDLRLHSTWADETGHLAVSLRIAGRAAHDVKLLCAGEQSVLRQSAPGVFAGRLSVPDAAPWWPHTHGDPALHDVGLCVDGHTMALGRTGFRSVTIDRGADGAGFGFVINGEPIFCRGAVWTPPDLVGLPGTREAYEPTLRLMREAGMNMVRVGATGVYETRAFHDLCDEFGLLVWQDVMLSNFDYPSADPAFVQSVRQEVDALMARTQLSPSLAIVCGGSEIKQQAAMLGLPARHWAHPLLDTVLHEQIAAWRRDLAYVAHTPDGGAMPFEPQAGLCHYYGVSAYQRPLDDARQAGVRFATECLGFAHVPDAVAVNLEPNRAAIVQPLWGTRHPGDVGAIWFFEGVRNHYLAELYGVDPEALRRENPDRYLDLSRAVTAEIIEEVFARWRRVGSPTRGGLIWFLRDVFSGAGWGILDVNGAPKAAWHGARRAFRPVQVLITDEGLNGTHVHLINETAFAVAATITLRCWRDDVGSVMQAEQAVVLPPRSAQAMPATDLWGAFFDTNYAYRFGPPTHEVTMATLTDAAGTVLAEAFAFPVGRGSATSDVGLQANAGRDPEGAFVDVAVQRFAQSVHVTAPGFRARDNWFHLAPGRTVRVRLIQTGEGRAAAGLVAAVNGTTPVRFEIPA